MRASVHATLPLVVLILGLSSRANVMPLSHL
jgi:hypothetical protein